MTEYVLYRNWLIDIPDMSPCPHSRRYRILEVAALDGKGNYAIPYVERDGRACLIAPPEDIIGPFDTLERAMEARKAIVASEDGMADRRADGSQEAKKMDEVRYYVTKVDGDVAKVTWNFREAVEDARCYDAEVFGACDSDEGIRLLTQVYPDGKEVRFVMNRYIRTKYGIYEVVVEDDEIEVCQVKGHGSIDYKDIVKKSDDIQELFDVIVCDYKNDDGIIYPIPEDCVEYEMEMGNGVYGGIWTVGEWGQPIMMSFAEAKGTLLNGKIDWRLL